MTQVFPAEINQIPPDIRIFLESLLEDAGMQLTDELKEAMVADLYNKLEKKMIADALENMKSEDVDEFVKLIQSSKDQTQIQQYINSHLPNAKDIFVQSLVDFKTYFLGGTMQANSVSQT